MIIPSTSFVSKDDNSIYTRILTLEQVTLEYIGEYSCTAENEGGEISDMINVTVYGKNVCVFLHHLFHFFFLIHFCKLDKYKCKLISQNLIATE